MKKYSNNVTAYKVAVIFGNIVFLGISLYRIITYKESDDFSGFIAMVVLLPTCALTMDFVLILLRKQFYTTYYNDYKIEQRFLFGRKSININDISQIIVLGNAIILLYNNVDLNKLPKSNRKILKELENNVLLVLGDSDSILSIISKSNCKKIDLIRPSKQVTKRISAYFNV